MKAAFFMLFAGAVSAAAEGVFSGAPNPGWVRHSAIGLTGLQMLLGAAVLAIALLLVLLPRRERSIGFRLPAAAPPGVTPALLLPLGLVLLVGVALVMLRRGDVAALASVFFATMTSLVLLHAGSERLSGWMTSVGAGTLPAVLARLESGLTALPEAVSVAALSILIAFLPQDCAALGVLMFALVHSLVTYAHAGAPDAFRSRVLARGMRSSTVLVAVIYLMQTAFKPTSIEAIVMVEFFLVVRLLGPLVAFLAERFFYVAVTKDLMADEAVELRGWLRLIAVIAAICGTGFLILSWLCADGFFIHRGLWWSLPLPIYLGVILRAAVPAWPGAAGAMILVGMLGARLTFILTPMEYLVSGTHGAMAWGLALVLLAWGWTLGEPVDAAGDRQSRRPELEGLALAVVGLIMLNDWFDGPERFLSLLDFKVVAGLLLGALWCHWMFGGADAAREQSGNWATWRLPALAFVFPAGGIAVGLPVISEFVFAAALLMLAMTYGVRHAGDPLATRARLHFATLVGLLGMAIAAEVLQRLGNAPHALTVRLTLGGLLLAGGVAAGRLGHRFGATLCQASK